MTITVTTNSNIHTISLTRRKAGKYRQEDESFCFHAFPPPPNCGAKPTFMTCVSHKNTRRGSRNRAESKAQLCQARICLEVVTENTLCDPGRSFLNIQCRRGECRWNIWSIESPEVNVTRHVVYAYVVVDDNGLDVD